jgi:hypothetical protein
VGFWPVRLASISMRGLELVATQTLLFLFAGIGGSAAVGSDWGMRDPDLVPVTVANVLGVREEPGRPVLDTLVEAVDGRSLLVLLDNCEHVIGSCAKPPT